MAVFIMRVYLIVLSTEEVAGRMCRLLAVGGPQLHHEEGAGV